MCTLITVLLAALQGLSQDCSIVGTWKKTGYEVGGKLKGMDDTLHYYLTFYEDGKIQSNWSTGKLSSIRPEYTYVGTYEFDGEKSIRYQYAKQESKKSKVISCSDSTLILESKYIELGLSKDYYVKQIEIIPFVATIEEPVRTESVREENDFSFYLVNTEDASKKIQIKERGFFEIGYSRDSPFLPNAKENIRCEGRVLDVDSIVLKIEPLVFDATTEIEKDSCTIYVSLHYKEDVLNVSEIPIPKIDWIEYTSPSAATGQTIGSLLVTVGIYSLLIATPIASINSKKGIFDREKAYLVGGASLGLVALSVPFFAFSRTKQYKINKDVFSEDQEYWRVVKGE